MKNRLVPFLLLGVAIVVFTLGFMLFFYLLVLGAFVGAILFIATWVKEKFFPSKTLVRREKEQKAGRIIDHEK